MKFTTWWAAALVLPGCTPASSNPVAPPSDPSHSIFGEPAPSPEEPEPTNIDPTQCALRAKYRPKPLQGSVFTLSSETMDRIWKPLIEVACACVVPGTKPHLNLVIDPSMGHVEIDSRDTSLVSKCFRKYPIRFEPFRFDSDCIGCGPSGTTPRAILCLPWIVDRSAETGRTR